MSSDIAAVAEAHWDRVQARQDDEAALQEYLDERGITMEQYKVECDQAAEDAAADRYQESLTD